jgi:hypothetical protein
MGRILIPGGGVIPLTAPDLGDGRLVMGARRSRPEPLA